MESEKVKEIKKLIRYLADTYGTSKCLGKPNRELFADILTLINELEEEMKATNEILAERDGLKAEIERLKAVLEIKQKQAVKEFAEMLKRDSICTTQYEDGTKILTTSNKLIDQAVNIYMQIEGLI